MCVVYFAFLLWFTYIHLQLFVFFRGIERNDLKIQHFKFALCKYILSLKFLYKASG